MGVKKTAQRFLTKGFCLIAIDKGIRSEQPKIMMIPPLYFSQNNVTKVLHHFSNQPRRKG